MFSRFFIDRPIFAAVLSIFIVIAGLAAMRNLPIAQYPEIAPPVVTVTANYPGASAGVIEQTVAAPLENQINGVEHMIYMSSTSTSNGQVQIHVTFDIGTDIDQATVNINNRVRQAEPRLPADVRRLGVTVEKGSSSFLQVLAFYSPTGRYDDLYTSNYVTVNVLDQLKRVPGTTNVQKTMNTLSARFPDGLTYSVPYDTTRFVEVSIREVLKTLGEAMLLVFLVVFLFLQNWRATLIPFAAVPVSLIGTFAGLYLLGYSINTLTLFGMVLAIGIVVDDAIVVLENVERIMHEEHLDAREAAVKAMREVTSPIIAIVLVLCAVFVPIAFLGGLTGELYRQFAITISIAVVISGAVALTVTPALCVLILKREHKRPGRFFTWFNDWFHRVTGRYTDGVAWMIRRGGIGVTLFVGMVALAVGLWRITPGSLVPDEDQGYYIAAVILPDGASLERTDRVVSEVVEAIRSNPANENAIAFTGFDFIGGGYRNNAATVFVTQKHWDERSVTASQLVGELFMKTAPIKEALVLAFNPPPIFGLGTAGGFEFYIQNRGEGGPKRSAEVLQQFLARAGKEPQLGFVNAFWRAR